VHLEMAKKAVPPPFLFKIYLIWDELPKLGRVFFSSPFNHLQRVGADCFELLFPPDSVESQFGVHEGPPIPLLCSID